LSRENETVVFEALKVPNMVRSASGSLEEPGINVAQKSGLNRSIHDAGWGRLVEFTSYKAVRAGGRVMKVDPRHSSNECHRCGVTTPTPIGALFTCGCGIAMDRDHNAALVILKRGVVAPDVATVKAVQA
jgi:putative transposase